MLAPTPRDRLVDQHGRPYFLWDAEMTLEEFERVVNDPQAATRPYLIGKLMRQAKPDDALQFVSPQEIADLWPTIERYLGKSRPFWSWLLDENRSQLEGLPHVVEQSIATAGLAGHRFGDAENLVDSARAILAKKLCALLERSEPRDLVDIEALLRAGEKLDVALADAPRRDGGFSPLTLAWVLRDVDIHAVAQSAGLDEAAAAQLDAFRRWLIGELVSVGPIGRRSV